MERENERSRMRKTESEIGERGDPRKMQKK